MSILWNRVGPTCAAAALLAWGALIGADSGAPVQSFAGGIGNSSPLDVADSPRTTSLRSAAGEAGLGAACARGVLEDVDFRIALDGPLMLVGDTVYRFDRPACAGTGCPPWTQEAVLAPDGGPVPGFGSAGAVSGSRIIVGARHARDLIGAAYVFLHDGATWVQEAELAPFGDEPARSFGCSVDLDGDVAVVGSFWGFENNNPPGAAWIFRHDRGRWQPEAALTPSDGADGDVFGQAVAIEGDLVVVGAVGDDDHGEWTGATYVFRRDADTGQWSEEAKLLASDAHPQGFFGHSVDVSSGVVAAAGVGSDETGPRFAGFIFRQTGSDWIEEAKLRAPVWTSFMWFGTRIVSLSDDTALVTTFNDGEEPTGSGSAWIYRYDGVGWSAGEVLRPSAPETNSWFGYSADIDGDVTIVAAFNPTSGLPGQVHPFHGLSGTDCNRNGAADSCDLLDGLSMDLNANGIPDECEPRIGDLDGDGVVGGEDLILLLASWGDCADPPESCIADLDGDGTVGIMDLLALLAAWG